jgi:DNA-binding IclR family transcriptional regulator
MEKDEGPLQRLLGDTAAARVLDFLTVFRAYDYSLTDIARNSGVGRMTLFRVWPNLERYGVVVQTRTVGKAKMYRLNPESKIAENLAKLGLQVAKVDADGLMKVPNKRLETPIST